VRGFSCQVRVGLEPKLMKISDPMRSLKINELTKLLTPH